MPPDIEGRISKQAILKIGAALAVSSMLATHPAHAQCGSCAAGGGSCSGGSSCGCTGCSGDSGSSDIRLKKEIKPIDCALDKMLTLHGVYFQWKNPERHGNLTGTQIGMIAQEVEKIFPQWVGTDTNGFKTLIFRGFEALTVESVKQLKLENDGLKSEVESLKQRVQDLESTNIAVQIEKTY